MSDTAKIDRAMVLAAGLGTRMRPITDHIPKPLVTVSGKTLLDHALDALAFGDVEEVVVNVHYLAGQIEALVSSRIKPKVTISDERDQLLDSGGGVKNAIGDFPPGPLFILNADSFWVDGNNSTISAMKKAWQNDTMDMMMLVATPEQAVGFNGRGDFFMDTDGKLTRRGDADTAPYIYAGAIIARAEAFHAVAEDVFSLNRLFDEAIANAGLVGFPLDGLWLHVGTPDAIGDAERAIEQRLSTQKT